MEDLKCGSTSEKDGSEECIAEPPKNFDAILEEEALTAEEIQLAFAKALACRTLEEAGTERTEEKS